MNDSDYERLKEFMAEETAGRTSKRRLVIRSRKFRVIGS